MKDICRKREICIYVILGILIFYSVLLICLLLCNTYIGGMSSEIEDWNEYGAAYSNWLLPAFSLINICVLVLVNATLRESNENLNRASIQAEKERLKIELLFTEYKTFKKNWRRCYDNYQESASCNQPSFDALKSTFCKGVGSMAEVDPCIWEIKEVRDWVAEFEYVSNHYNNSDTFDQNEATFPSNRDWTSKEKALFGALLTFIWERNS